MKSILKNWGKIALIMIVTGVVLLVLSFLLGARGGYAYIGAGGLKIASARDDLVINEIDLSPFDVVEVKASHSDIELIASDHYGLEMRLPSSTSEPHWDITNGKLTVETLSERNIFRFMDFGLISYYIRIYYPGNDTASFGAELTSTDLNTGSGNILLSKVSTEIIRLKTSSGGVRVDVKDYRAATVQTNSGDITFNGNGNNADLTISATSGTINADVSGCIKVDANTNSGDITINGKTPSNAALSVSAKSGRAVVDVYAWQFLTVETRSGDIRIAGEPFGSTSAKARSGVVTMKLRGVESDFSYDFSAGSGSIRFGGQRLGSPARNISNTAAKKIEARTTSGNIRVDFD